VVTNEPPEDQTAQENNNNSRSETHNWLAGKRLWLKLDNPFGASSEHDGCTVMNDKERVQITYAEDDLTSVLNDLS